MAFLRKASLKLKPGEDGTMPRTASSGSVKDPRQRVVDGDDGSDTAPRRKSSLA